MSNSLLAHLYPHIKGSQEDVATLSLQYIITSSTVLNQEFTKIIYRALQLNITDKLNFVCQAVGKNRERPDIAGIDADGSEKILCEAKFYAGLTENQPGTYLDRLCRNGGHGLAFICPTVRQVSLWNKLLSSCEEKNFTRIDDYCVEMGGVRMTILTWNDILESLRHAAAAQAMDFLPDIYQLDGLCRLMDSEAFIPLTPEDLGPEIARREERYFRIVDELIELLKADKALHPSTKGVKATAYRQGYAKGIKIRDFWITVSYDRELWINPGSEETPFWITIRSGHDWEQTDDILKAMQRVPAAKQELKWGMKYLALCPLLYGTLDETVASMKTQIMDYIDIVKEEHANRQV